MKLRSLSILAVLVPGSWALGYPECRSLAGLSRWQVQEVLQTFSSTPGPQPLPPPISDTSAKLMYDDAHPYLPPGPGDVRGPCPRLNTLASRGAPFDVPDVIATLEKVSSLVGVKPGHNEGAGNYVLDREDTGTKRTKLTALLYQDPTPELAAAIKANLITFYQALDDPTCEQLFPLKK